MASSPVTTEQSLATVPAPDAEAYTAGPGEVRPLRRPVLPLVWCAGMLTLFAILAWASVRTKSATCDEPYHAAAAWAHARLGDFRINPEDPPLWKHFAMLPQPAGALRGNTASPHWRQLPEDLMSGWIWGVHELYRTSGVDADAFLARSRAVMLVLGVALGGLIAWWSWKLAGGVAASAAIALYCLDPNFLAHAPLVKNDVALTLLLAAFAMALWRLGLAATVPRGIAVALLCAAGLVTKFSGVLFVPLLMLVLLARVALPLPWTVFGRELSTWVGRLVAALAIGLATGVVSYAAIWAAYGFRFAPSAEPGVLLNTPRIVATVARNELMIANGGRPAALTPEFMQTWRPPAVVRAVLWLESHRVLPQAWLNGFLYTYASAMVRPTFLLGETSRVGWRYYFPVAMALKTPLATLAAVSVGLVGVGIWLVRTRGEWRTWSWHALCLTAPVGVYGGSALASNLNLGLRHILPIYPYLFIVAGVAAAWAWRRRPAMTAVAGIALAVALAAETLAAFPHYIAFFNATVRGPEHAAKLLGDSNLDWGQDLKLLAQWQREHPDRPLFLCYFGQADPAYYGIRYINLPGGYQLGPEQTMPPPGTSGVLAVSATHLQGIYSTPELNLRELYAPVRASRPFEVLGGSIFLYEYPLRRDPP